MRHNFVIHLFNMPDSRYSQALESSGYRCVEFGNNMSAPPMDTSAVIIGMRPVPDDLARSIAPFATRICIVPEHAGQVKNILMKTGISDAITDPSPSMLVQIVDAIIAVPPDPSGEIVIMDREQNHRDMLSSIISRFSYFPRFLSPAESLIEIAGRQNISLIAVNLGDPGLDLKGLIRAYNSSSSLKRVPLIAYHDADRGIYIHELLAGLHRITSYILSTVELYSFLVEILFRREISPLIDGLHSRFNADDINFSTDPLSRIYNEHRDRLFSLKCVLDDETAASTVTIAEMIRRVLMRTEGLRWLASRPVRVEKVTCGAGALF